MCIEKQTKGLEEPKHDLMMLETNKKFNLATVLHFVHGLMTVDISNESKMQSTLRMRIHLNSGFTEVNRVIVLFLFQSLI